MNEKEMRESDAPWPKTQKELTKYVNSLVTQDHDYGTCVYAMSLSALAAYRYVASKLGVSGFQAGCADMDFIRRVRGLEGPYMLVDVSQALFPQYDISGKVADFLSESSGWLAEKATENLAKVSDAHPNVIAHWQALAAKKPTEKKS